MALSANATMTRVAGTDKSALKVAGSTHIYTGALVGRNPAGYAKAFQLGDEFYGVSNDEFNQTGTADGAVSVAGDISVAGIQYCAIWVGGDIVMSLSGAGVEDIGKAVYASADDAIAFTGNADAFVGRIVALEPSVTNGVRIKLKDAGEKTTPTDLGSLRLFDNGAGMREPTGAASTTKYYENGFTAKSILGLGVSSVTGSGGGIDGEFDAVAEVALASLRSNDLFPVASGVRMRVRACVTDKGDNAALDIDLGLGTLLTTNSEADLSHADMVNKVAFHMDGNSDNVLGWSENANTEVAAVDTTIDNDSATDTFKDYLIIVRADGACELWIDSGSGFVRVLNGTTGAATTLSVASGVALSAFVNAEKTADDTTAKIRVKEIEVTGGRTIAIG